MKVITWNCNGAFRRKCHHLDQLDADVLVIQECEDPAQSTPEYRDWAGEHAWLGHSRHRGIGIFPRKGQSLQCLNWQQERGGLFLPVKLDGDLTVVGVWTLGRKISGDYSYIGQFWHYLQLHKARLEPSTVICGDFNSNAIWDGKRKARNHSISVRELEDIGLRSLYHSLTGEAHGQELQSTFFLQRSEQKAYHIDYVFLAEEICSAVDAKIHIGDRNKWILESDHLPIIAEWSSSAAQRKITPSDAEHIP